MKKHGKRIVGLTVVFLFCHAEAAARDSDEVRPYVHLRSAAFNEAWGVEDGWGISAGFNFNRWLSLELALDNFESDLDDPRFGPVGEQAITTLIPRARIRFPLGEAKRWVPYGIAGVGAAFMQFNDEKPVIFGSDVQSDATRLAAVAGLGLEYFVADNVTFNLEGQYLWVDSHSVRIEGRRQTVDRSTPMLLMGVRAYFRESERQPLAYTEGATPTRYYGGFRFGGSILLEKRMNKDLILEPEASAWLREASHAGGVMFGGDYGRHWGWEVVGDFAEYALESRRYGLIGEYSVYSLVPHGRWRWPIGEGRFVPFVVAGAGAVYSEFNDRKPDGEHLRIKAKGVYPTASLGAGLEYFAARNLSISAESRAYYSWKHRLRIDGEERGRGDFSAVNLYLGMRFYLIDR